MIDLSPLLKVSARLLDLHDSSRGPGASTQYQTEERTGLKDGRYVAIAGEVITALQDSGKRSGDAYSSVDFVVLRVREALAWAHELDVEFVLNVLSRPSILTSHAKQAEIFIGETRPYVTGTSFNGFTGGGSQSQYQQTQIGIRLSVLPLINSEGLVVMDIKQSIQQVGENVKIDNNLVPTTVDREASAYIAVHDRDTVILGGFISSNKRNSNGGVPLLKDIPIIGNLFRSTSESKGRVELVVMMRPTVMQTPEIAALASAETIDKKLPGIKRAIRDNEKMELQEQKKNQNDKESIKP